MVFFQRENTAWKCLIIVKADVHALELRIKSRLSYKGSRSNCQSGAQRRVHLLQSFFGLSSQSSETDATAKTTSGNDRVETGRRILSARSSFTSAPRADKYGVLLKCSEETSRVYPRKKRTQVRRSDRGIHLRRSSWVGGKTSEFSPRTGKRKDEYPPTRLVRIAFRVLHEEKDSSAAATQVLLQMHLSL